MSHCGTTPRQQRPSHLQKSCSCWNLRGCLPACLRTIRGSPIGAPIDVLPLWKSAPFLHICNPHTTCNWACSRAGFSAGGRRGTPRLLLSCGLTSEKWRRKKRHAIHFVAFRYYYLRTRDGEEDENGEFLSHEDQAPCAPNLCAAPHLSYPRPVDQPGGVEAQVSIISCRATTTLQTASFFPSASR